MRLQATLERLRRAPQGAGELSDSALRRDVLQLGLPAVGEQALSLLVNVVNTMLVGHLGAPALAAVGLSGSISSVAGTFFAAVAVGGTALIAQAVGAGDRRSANRVLQQSLLLGLVLGLLACAVLVPLARPSLVLMGAEAKAVELGAAYLTWIALSLPFSSLMFIGSGSLRGAGDTRTPMMIMGGVNIINLVLSFVLVRGLGPIPVLGVRGVGIAAFTGTASGCIAVLALLMRGHGALHLRRLPTRLDLPVLRRLADISLPAGGETLLFRLAFLAYTRAVSSLGTVPYAAYLVTMRVEALSNTPASGFAVAATTLSGQSIGAGKPDLARRYVLKAIELTLYVSLTAGLLFLTVPRFFLGLFTPEVAVVSQGVAPLRVVALGLPAVAYASGFSGGLRGAGDTRTVMASTGIGSWLVRVPIALLSVTWLGLGLAGLQASMVLDYVVRALILGWRFRPAAWAKRALAHAPGAASQPQKLSSQQP